jgi:hypothetical protein
MNRGDYGFAELKPDAVNAIRQAEREISNLCGHPVTLIAYQADPKARSPEPPADLER